MGRFEFRKKEIALDIAGVKAFVPGTVDFMERLRQIGEEMVSFGEQAEDMEQAEEFMLGVLDELLGETVMDQIEGERKLDIYDCCDLFRYIAGEVKQYHEKKAAVYQPKADVPPVEPSAQPIPMAQAAVENREARRKRQRAERRASGKK